MSDVSSAKSDFEQVVNRSYDIAVKLKHEYVILEHVLMALLEFSDVEKMFTQLGCNVDQIKMDLETFLNDPSYNAMVINGNYQPKYTTTLLNVIKQAKAQSMFMGKSSMTAFDMLLAMFSTEQSWAVYLLNKHDISKSQVTNWLTQSQSTASAGGGVSTDDAKMLLSQYAVNLNQRATQKKINPLIGREQDVGQLVETLARKIKNNVILVGHSGVGKTQLVEGLARRIVEKQVPDSLLTQEIWSLDINSIVAGTKYRGDFEERMKHLIQALKSLPNVILFIDEIHMIMGAGGGQSSMDAANILKPALGRGEIRTIGSTTFEEFRKHFEKDRALLRRFQRQDVVEPSPEDSKKIIRGLLPDFEKFHKVSYDVACVDTAVDLSVKYLFNKHLPDKAIDLIDAAGAAVKISSNVLKTVGVNQIESQISKMAQINIESVSESSNKNLADLDVDIKKNLFGQDHAVQQLCEAVWMSYSGLRENNKTMGSFLLSGPSGVGKTEVAKLLAEKLGYAFVKFDMSEFQEKHSISRFIGSPPGYVGYSDGNAGSGALINAIDTNPSCVLLIDEVEKAHPDVLNVFLQGMDKGMITSQNQKSISLKTVILIFTSNLGAAAMEKSAIGFGRDSRSDEDTVAIKQFFAPEFRNRLDAIIPFSPLSRKVILMVVDKFLHQLDHLAQQKNVKIVVDPSVKEWLADNGFDPTMGARPLSRVIDQHIKKPMSKEILFGKLASGGSVLVKVEDSTKLKLEFLREYQPAGIESDSDQHTQTTEELS